MAKKLPSGLPPAPTSNFKIGLDSPLLLTVLVAVLATFLMPRHTPFSYKYAVGEAWKYPTLKAPFDFDVLRPEAEVRDQLARIEQEHGRYYRLLPEVGRGQKRRFSQLLNEQARISRNDVQYTDLVANTSAYENYGLGLLDEIYERGLADATDFQEAEAGAQIWVSSGKDERRVSPDQVFTLKTARSFLTDSLPFSALRQPEYLLPLLEKSLAPNLVFSDSLTAMGKERRIAAVRNTGVRVSKGEKIVEAGQPLTPDQARKLESLAQHFGEKSGWETLLGYFLAALLSFGFYFFWLKNHRPEDWKVTEKRLLPVASILLGLALVGLANRAGAAIPLLLPVCVLPVLVARLYDLPTGLATWANLLFISAFGLDWGIGWACIQAVGGLTAVLFFQKTNSWRGRVTGAAVVGAAMILAWLASWLAGRLPEALQLADVPVFLAVAAFLSLGVFPLQFFLVKFFEKNESDLPVKIGGR